MKQTANMTAQPDNMFGVAFLNDPQRNKGTAFTEDERRPISLCRRLLCRRADVGDRPGQDGETLQRGGSLSYEDWLVHRRLRRRSTALALRLEADITQAATPQPPLRAPAPSVLAGVMVRQTETTTASPTSTLCDAH